MAVALAFALAAFAGCREKEDGRTLFESGLKEMRSGNLPVAYRELHRALTAFQEAGDTIGCFEAKANLSLLCSFIGQKEEGYSLIKSTPYYHIRRTKNYSSQYYLRLKSYYSFTLESDYATAVNSLRQLIELDKSDFPERKEWQYMDLANLAELYFVSAQPQKAQEIVDYIDANSLKTDMYMSQLYYVKALLLKKSGDMAAVRHYAMLSQQHSAKNNAPENELNSFKILMELDSMQNDLEEYIAHRNAHDSIAKKMNGAEMAHHIAVLQEQHKYEMAMKDADRRSKMRAIWQAGSLLVAVAVCIIVFLLYRQNRMRLKTEKAERMRLDSEIQYKKLENEMLAMKMEQAKKQLETSQRHNALAARQLAAEEHAKTTATKLEMLEATLRADHSAFMEFMESEYPQLTYNNLLILGLFRLGLSVQETAVVLGISVDSLQKAVFRIRKKMSVGSMDSLVEFVKNWEREK